VRTDAARVHRRPAAATSLMSIPAPYAIAHAPRIVSTISGLWGRRRIAHHPGAVRGRTFSRWQSVDVPERPDPRPVASDGAKSLFALIGRAASPGAAINCSGRVVETFDIEGLMAPRRLCSCAARSDS